jgi:parallel beta-helix repeat protein
MSKYIYIFLITIAFVSINCIARGESFYSRYQLPPVERMPAQNQGYKLMQASQVMKRLHSLPVKPSEIEDPDNYVKALSEKILQGVDHLLGENSQNDIVFSGSSTMELDRFIQQTSADHVVFVSNKHIRFNGTVHLRNGVALKGNKSIITGANAQDTVFLVHGVENTAVSGFTVDGAGVGIYVADSRRFVFRDLKFKGCNRGLIVQGRSEYGLLDYIEADGSYSGGILIAGPAHYVMVKNSLIRNGKDYFNWHAGLVMTDTPLKGFIKSDDKTFSVSAVRTSINAATETVPYSNVIQGCTFYKNKAPGIYTDGGAGNVIVNNVIENNDKEGMCLDGGSSLNVVRGNLIKGNGFRRRQTDEDLSRDFVSGFGRMDDGSSVAKLPGISLDNAAYNIILENTIKENAGDGIKMVRSCFKNIIMFNNILSNNKGQNKVFHFFGVLIGNAPSDSNSEKELYDFLPCYENIISSNVIYGQHYSGVLLDFDAAFNDIYNNTIFKFLNLPVEVASREFNSIVENVIPTGDNAKYEIEHKKWKRLFFAILILLIGSNVLVAIIVRRYISRKDSKHYFVK